MFKYTIHLFLLLLVLVSCTKDDMSFDIGSDKLDIKTHMGYIDTFTVKSYTVMLDSIPTSGLDTSSILIGRYEDAEIGTVTAGSFFRLYLPGTINLKQNDGYDSIKLFLIYNNYFAGDTTKPFSINVHRLLADMKPNDDGYFYNNDSIAASDELLGHLTLRPSPSSGDTIWIPLDDNLGSELFQMMVNDDYRVQEINDFVNYFKGLMVNYTANDEAIIGFKFPRTESDIFPAVRLYYHLSASPYTRRSMDFKVQISDQTSSRKIQFNRFTLSNSAIPLPSVQTGKLSSELVNKRSYLLSGAGIVTRFEVPYIKNLYNIDDDIRIIDADLQFEPVQNTYTNTPLPANLSLYYTDDLNRFGREVTNKSGNSQTADLSIDRLYQEETFYIFDVTSFMTSKLVEQSDDIPAMLLTVSVEELYRTTKRLVLGSQSHPRNKVKLKVYYMNIE